MLINLSNIGDKVSKFCRCYMGVGESDWLENQTAKGGRPPPCVRAHICRVIAQIRLIWPRFWNKIGTIALQPPWLLRFPTYVRSFPDSYCVFFWSSCASERSSCSPKHQPTRTYRTHMMSRTPESIVLTHTYTRARQGEGPVNRSNRFGH